MQPVSRTQLLAVVFGTLVGHLAIDSFRCYRGHGDHAVLYTALLGSTPNGSSTVPTVEDAGKCTLQIIRDVCFDDSVDIWISEQAKKHALDRDLLQALVLVESRGRPNATSPKGAKGLLQLMPATARYYGVDPGNPRENLEGGARHLAALLKRYDGNLNLTLAAWNAGDTALRTWRGVPPYKETRRFIAKVKVAKEVLEAE